MIGMMMRQHHMINVFERHTGFAQTLNRTTATIHQNRLAFALDHQVRMLAFLVAERRAGAE